MLRVLLQVVFGGGAYPGLLARVHRFRRRSEAGGSPITHLDKHQRIGMAHDQVDFTKTTAIVAFQQAQPLGLQMLAGLLLGIMSLP